MKGKTFARQSQAAYRSPHSVRSPTSCLRGPVKDAFLWGTLSSPFQTNESAHANARTSVESKILRLPNNIATAIGWHTIQYFLLCLYNRHNKPLWILQCAVWYHSTDCSVGSVIWPLQTKVDFSVNVLNYS